MKNEDTLRNLFLIVIGTGLVLLVPLMGMVLSSEWNWDPADFMVVSALILVPTFTYELVVKRFVSLKYRAVFGFVLAAAAILLWIELAVGIFH